MTSLDRISAIMSDMKTCRLIYNSGAIEDLELKAPDKRITRSFPASGKFPAVTRVFDLSGVLSGKMIYLEAEPFAALQRSVA